MKTKILLLFSAILLSVSLQAQNSIDLVNPPASVNADSMVDITFNYTLEVDGWAYIRFKNGDATENNLTEVSIQLTAGSGTQILSLPIPARFGGVALPLGAGYNYQAQLFSTTWEGLDTKDYNGVTLLAALPKANDMNMVTYPTTVTAGSFVDITLDYVTDKANVFVIVRFRDQTNLTQADKVVNLGSEQLTLSLEIPVNDANGDPLPLGSDYSFQLQMFDFNGPTGWGSAIVSKNYSGITLEEFVPPANSLSVTTAPTSVAASADVDVTFDYVTDLENADIFVFFKQGLVNVGRVSKIVTAGSGTITLPVPIPEDALGEGYSYQLQIFDIDAGYASVALEDVADVTVTEVPAKTVKIPDPTTAVLMNSTVDVTVSYTKDIADESIVLVRFLDVDGNTVTQALEFVTPNSGEVTLTLDTPATEGMYSYQAELWSDDISVLYFKKRTWGVTVSETLSAANFKNDFENLLIYPNPFNESFTYQLDANLSDVTNIELFTIGGKRITSIEHNPSFGNSGTIPTSQLSQGIYFVRITSGDSQTTRKLIKN